MIYRDLYEGECLSINQIAVRLGIAPTRVRTVLRRLGVTFRSRQEGRALRRGNEKTRRSFTRKRVAA